MHAETDFKHYALNPDKVWSNLGDWLEGESAAMLVAQHDNGSIVGFFAGKLARPWFSDDLCAVEDCFYVAAPYRGSRAAYMLVREWRQWAKQHGSLHDRAGVSSGSGPAGERLYEHFGLKHMGGNFIAHNKEHDHVL